MYKWFVNLHLHTAEQHPIPSTTSPTLKLSLSDGTTKFSQLSTLSNTVTTGSPHPSMTPTQPTTMSTMEAHDIIPTLSNTVTTGSPLTTGSPHPSMTPTQPTTMSTMEAHDIITIAVTTGVLIVGCVLIVAVLGCVGGVCWIFRKKRKRQKKMEEVSNVPPQNQDERIQLVSVCSKNSGMNCTLKIV